MFYRINYNRTGNIVRLESNAVSAPAALGGAYQDLGSFKHDEGDNSVNDDPLPGQKVSESHALYHHVQDALYRLEGEQDMSAQVIYRDRIRTINIGADSSLAVAATLQLTPVFAPLSTENTGVTYVSSDPTKATVNANGLVTGVAAGTTTITATSQDDATVNDTRVITVTA